MASFSEVQEAVLGLTDKMAGLSKEAIGTLAGRRRIADAGRAQQDKGSARLDAIRHEASADASRAKAAANDRVERAHQDRPVSGRGGSEFSQTGPKEGAGGVAERVKGRVKEAAGAVVDNEDMRREGQAQQAKGRARTEAAKEEAAAESSRGRVRAAEGRQRAAEELEDR
jgi:uncharacterized protein YjbJ (UPF0337 family)